jgi:hypothetical protein
MNNEEEAPAKLTVASHPGRCPSLGVRSVAIAALALSAGLVLSACGGSASPGVVSLGSTTTTTAAPSLGGGAASNGLASAEKFSSCIRSHGILDFPDPVPGPGGGYGFKIRAGPGSDLDPNSPRFQAAQKACQKYAPPPPTPAERSRALAAALKFATCMRSHGAPNFPDPVQSSSGIQIKIGGGTGTGLSPNSPQFQAAQKACSSYLPGGGP